MQTSNFRICPITGHALVSEEIRQYLYGDKYQPLPDISTKRQIAASMRRFDLPEKAPELIGQVPIVPSIFPKLEAESLREHLETIANRQVNAWRENITDIARAQLPPKPEPDEIVWSAGWFRYAPDQPVTKVSYPLESAIVFDCETMVKLGNTAIMAAAVSVQAWYIWLHPCLADPVPGSKPNHFDRRLIPIGENKVIVGHNVSFDKARCAEPYSVENMVSTVKWVDTMSMHYAVSGLSNQQRQFHVKVSSDLSKGYIPDFIPAWYEAASMANLVDVYNHHVKPSTPLDLELKTIRDLFVISSSTDTIYERRLELLLYNLNDVAITAELHSVLWPKYLLNNPSSVTLSGALLMGDYLLTLDSDWLEWCQVVELTYRRIEAEIGAALIEIANDVHASWLAGEFDPSQHEWLKHLDWTPAKTGKNKGHAAWFRKAKGKVTTRGNLAPYLLGLSWEGSPLRKVDRLGWCFPISEEDRESTSYTVFDTCLGPVCRVPHKGGEVNCGNPLAKDYLVYIDNGMLRSEDPRCKELLAKAASISYWISVRSRVLDDVLVNSVPMSTGKLQLVSIPMQVIHGTVTRRAVEKLWLTVCSSKRNRVGSELKAKVTCPKGYSFLQADFDSEEQRLGALLGDSVLGLHGSTPMGRITIFGTKENRDDAHWVLALQMEILRDVAKTINYAMLYGAMVSGLAKYLKQANSSWPISKCIEMAKKAIKIKRGNYYAFDRFGNVVDRKPKRGDRGIWVGGTDSSTYNVLERISNSELPRSPILGSCISEGLRPGVVGTEFATSRANWVIQTSGVDMLHCWLTGFNWLKLQYNLDCRVIFSYHDEVLVMVKRGQEARVAQMMQIAHLWAWTCACESLGINDLPATYAWFSGINVDFIWRKEPDMAQITPSQPDDKPHGLALKPWDIWGDNCQEMIDLHISQNW